VTKKYNILPVIIACAVFGLLILIGTITAVVMMRKKKQEPPTKDTQVAKQDSNPNFVLEVKLQPVLKPEVKDETILETIEIDKYTEETKAATLNSAAKLVPKLDLLIKPELPEDPDYEFETERK
jgi:hypothetical protein